MALLTTTIGAYPKPDYVPTPDWFRAGGTGLSNPTEAYQKYLNNLPENIEEILDRIMSTVRFISAVATPITWIRTIFKKPTRRLTFIFPMP